MQVTGAAAHAAGALNSIRDGGRSLAAASKVTTHLKHGGNQADRIELTEKNTLVRASIRDYYRI
jgi:hypothetical protein